MKNPTIYNVTIGGGVTRVFARASSPRTVFDVSQLPDVWKGVPAEAGGASSLAVTPESFVDASSGDYRLSVGSPAVEAGVAIGSVTHDRAGQRRPAGGGYDIGAYGKVSGRALRAFIPSPAECASSGGLPYHERPSII